jgi:hypothetical protein
LYPLGDQLEAAGMEFTTAAALVPTEIMSDDDSDASEDPINGC